MSYVKVHTALGVTRDQQELLLDIPPEQLQSLSPVERLNLVLRRQEVKAAESSARWNSIATFVSVIVPITAFFGLSWVSGKKR